MTNPPARLNPKLPTLRISHFPDPPTPHYQPTKIHLTKRGAVSAIKWGQWFQRAVRLPTK
jgi:hypothetical protein